MRNNWKPRPRIEELEQQKDVVKLKLELEERMMMERKENLNAAMEEKKKAFELQLAAENELSPEKRAQLIAEKDARIKTWRKLWLKETHEAVSRSSSCREPSSKSEQGSSGPLQGEPERVSRGHTFTDWPLLVTRMDSTPVEQPSTTALESWTRLLAEGDDAAWRWFHERYYLPLLRYASQPLRRCVCWE